MLVLLLLWLSQNKEVSFVKSTILQNVFPHFGKNSDSSVKWDKIVLLHRVGTGSIYLALIQLCDNIMLAS